MERGHHRITGLGGQVTATIDSTWPYSPGTWHFVVFDDGFRCWVPDHEFTKGDRR